MVLSCTFLSKHKQQHIPSREKQVRQWNNYREIEQHICLRQADSIVNVLVVNWGTVSSSMGKKKDQENAATLGWYCDTSFCSGTQDSSPTVLLEICIAEIATNLSFLSLPPFIFRVLEGNKAYTLHSLLLRVTLANQHYRRFLVELHCLLLLGSSGFPLQEYEADFITGPVG